MNWNVAFSFFLLMEQKHQKATLQKSGKLFNFQMLWWVQYSMMLLLKGINYYIHNISSTNNKQMVCDFPNVWFLPGIFQLSAFVCGNQKLKVLKPIILMNRTKCYDDNHLNFGTTLIILWLSLKLKWSSFWPMVTQQLYLIWEEKKNLALLLFSKFCVKETQGECDIFSEMSHDFSSLAIAIS